ncbi:MAG: Gfo/Idh/MocA family oxidoreductase [Pseudomonadota bacterium]
MISVAILGAGIGREHLAGYEALPHLFEVVGLCDLDLERAEEVVGAREIRVATDAAEFINDPEIDLIDICLPPHLHTSVALKCLAEGKHVVCEKPLATSLVDVDALEQAEQGSSGMLFPVFQYRFGPAMAQFQALWAAEFTQDPHVASIETHWSRGADYYAAPWRGTWAGENGGAVLGHAIHNHDLISELMGPIASVSASTATRINPIETEDCAAIRFELESGALVTSSITLGAAGDTSRFRIVFDDVTAESGLEPYAPLKDRWTFTARDPAKQAEVDKALAKASRAQAGFAGYFEAVAKAIDGQASNAVRIADGRRSIELVAAIYLSARERRVIDLPLPSDAATYISWKP